MRASPPQSRRARAAPLAATVRSAFVALVLSPGCWGCAEEHPCVDEDGVAYASGFDDPLTSRVRLEGPRFVEVLEVQTHVDRLAYCSAVQGLNVFDISDADDPRLLLTKVTGQGGHESFPRCQHVSMSDAYIFVTNRGDEIQQTPFIAAFDNSGAVPTRLFTEHDEALTFETVDFRNDRLVAAAHQDGVVVYDVSPTGMTEAGRLSEGFENAWAVRFYNDDTILVGDGPGGLVVLSVAGDGALAVRGHAAFEGAATGSAQSIAIDYGRNIAFVAAGTAGLVAVDIGNLDAPSVLAVLDTPGNAVEIDLDRTTDARFGYLADWNDAKVIDLSDPLAMQLHAVERPAERAPYSRILGIAGQGRDVYMGEWHGVYSAEHHPEVQAPDVQARIGAVEFRRVDVGDTGAAAFIFENAGTAPLTLFDVKLGREGLTMPGLSVDKTSAELAPGEQAVIEVHYEAGDDKARTGEFLLCTDDPDEPARSVRVIANEPKIGIGDTMVPVELDLIGGGTWRSQEQSGPILLAYFATF